MLHVTGVEGWEGQDVGSELPDPDIAEFDQ